MAHASIIITVNEMYIVSSVLDKNCNVNLVKSRKQILRSKSNFVYLKLINLLCLVVVSIHCSINKIVKYKKNPYISECYNT